MEEGSSVSLGLMRDALVSQRLNWSTTTSPSRPRSMRPSLHCCAMGAFEDAIHPRCPTAASKTSGLSKIIFWLNKTLSTPCQRLFWKDSIFLPIFGRVFHLKNGPPFCLLSLCLEAPNCTCCSTSQLARARVRLKPPFPPYLSPPQERSRNLSRTCTPPSRTENHQETTIFYAVAFRQDNR